MECNIQCLEDMLRPCVIDCKGNWDDHFPLIEFLTIIGTTRVLIWLHLRPYMVEGVDFLYFFM